MLRGGDEACLASARRAGAPVVDCHVHLIGLKGYAEKIVRECDKIGIDRVCLLGGPPHWTIWGGRHATNEEVLKAHRKFPGRTVPFAYFDLGSDPVTKVDYLFAQGFGGLKLTCPRVSYDERTIYSVYARTSALGMPILFHTGTVLRTEWDYRFDVDCDRMRPIRLDTLARAFPEQALIGAHLGNPWYEEAAMAMFWNPNLFFDLSGTTLKRKSHQWFAETLWWNDETMARLAPDRGKTHYLAAGSKAHPWDRICFGSDVPVEEMASAFEDYHRMMDAVGLPDETRTRVMGGNLERILAHYGRGVGGADSAGEGWQPRGGV